MSECCRDKHVFVVNNAVMYDNGVQLGEFVVDVDGFYYFWPDTSRNGHWSAEVLHAVATLLNMRNREWSEAIEAEFSRPAIRI